MNILFILIDALGWKDLSIYGSEFYETPNIDSLAEDGVIFTNAYSASPVYSPTRASIMTGKYSSRFGITNYIVGCGWGSPHFGYFSPYKIPTLSDGLPGEYLTDRLTDEAIKIIKETEEPFFIFLSHYAVHIPIQVEEGSPTCNFPLREGKGWIEEGGVRVSLIVRYPGVTDKLKNRQCGIPVISTDFYPTILHMIGFPLIPEQHKDGVSLKEKKK